MAATVLPVDTASRSVFFTSQWLLSGLSSSCTVDHLNLGCSNVGYRWTQLCPEQSDCYPTCAEKWGDNGVTDLHLKCRARLHRCHHTLIPSYNEAVLGKLFGSG